MRVVEARRRPAARAARPRTRDGGGASGASEGRSLYDKGWAPLRYWAMWYVALGVAVAALLRHPDADLDRAARRRLDRRVQGAPAVGPTRSRNASTSACVRSRTTGNDASSFG